MEIEALALRGDPRAAAARLRTHVDPIVAGLPAAARAGVAAIAQDLRAVLEGKFPTPR